MNKSTYITKFADNGNAPEERTSTRIRAFLESIEPLAVDLDKNNSYVVGRTLIEDLARCCDSEENVQWEPEECAVVLRFLHWIQPVEGRCFCNDASRINATCGFHSVLIFLEDQMWRIGASVRRRKHAA